MKKLPSIVQAWVRGATESMEVSRAEAVAVWQGNIEATATLLISTGDLAQKRISNTKIVAIEKSVWNRISGKSNSIDVNYLKMRAERGFWDGRRNGEGEALGLTPTEILAAERKTDLAAKEAMAQLCGSQAPAIEYRGRALLGF